MQSLKYAVLLSILNNETEGNKMKKCYVDYKEGQGFRVVEVSDSNSSIVTRVWEKDIRSEESAQRLADRMNERL